MSIPIIQSSRPMEDASVAAVRDRLRGGQVTSARAAAVDVPGQVRAIIKEVRDRGDRALSELEARLDKVELSPRQLRVQPSALAAAAKGADGRFIKLIQRVRANIRQYQKSILLKAPPPMKRGGRSLGVRYTPVDRVGVYVPGGKAFYPSTVLMTVVPAQVAGVKEIALCSPPTSAGDVNPMVLALAAELGVTEVYRLGGAQAIAAMALGTASVRKVDKIVGPGNAFVAEAKRQLFGQVGIDSIAGPSEVLIVADSLARPDWIAADMLAQAEHDPGSAVLVTPSETLAARVAKAIDSQLGTLDRSAAARAAIEEYSAIIVVNTIDAACEVASDFAPEHLQIVTARPQALLRKIRHAGAIFLGANTPVPLGDYFAGPSHVLPTGGTARFFSALSCNDFLKASSVIAYDAASLAADADDVIDFAGREGLTAHARAVAVRRQKKR